MDMPNYKPEKAHYIVVTGIIIKDGKYLIIKFPPNDEGFESKWTVPGGTLEVSDYNQRPKDTSVHWYKVLEDVLRREVREETGLEIKEIGYVTSMVYIRPKDNIPSVIVSLFAQYASGEVVLSNEHVDFKWVTLEESKSYDLIEGIYEEIEMLDKHLKGKEMGEWKKN